MNFVSWKWIKGQNNDMRLAFNIAMVSSILFAPWWATAIILACVCLIFERFYESIVYGIIVDSLYATSYGINGFAYAATLFAVAIFIISSLIRNKLAWQGSERL